MKRGSRYQQLQSLSIFGIRNNENKDKWKFCKFVCLFTLLKVLDVFNVIKSA